jgi:hypothetical protein
VFVIILTPDIKMICICLMQWRNQEFCWGEGVQQIQLRTEERENGDLGAVAPSPLVMGSGGSCNLLQEISFHIVKYSSFLVI